MSETKPPYDLEAALRILAPVQEEIRPTINQSVIDQFLAAAATLAKGVGWRTKDEAGVTGTTGSLGLYGHTEKVVFSVLWSIHAGAATIMVARKDGPSEELKLRHNPLTHVLEAAEPDEEGKHADAMVVLAEALRRLARGLKP